MGRRGDEAGGIDIGPIRDGPVSGGSTGGGCRNGGGPMGGKTGPAVMVTPPRPGAWLAVQPPPRLPCQLPICASRRQSKIVQHGEIQVQTVRSCDQLLQ
jgi:hypothetical protein